MLLKVREQILITAVRGDVLRPGEVLEVDDAVGADLLKTHPDHFEEASRAAAKAAEPLANKMVPKPKNKGA